MEMKMKNALKHNLSKFILIGKIKGLAVESKKARVCILKAKKEEAVWNLASRKRVVGIDIRHHLLAYAFLRGVAYHAVERSCAKDNLPNAAAIFKIIEAHAPKWTPTVGSYNPSLADVNVWLAWPDQEAL
jgi:hypothetical protein